MVECFLSRQVIRKIMKFEVLCVDFQMDYFINLINMFSMNYIKNNFGEKIF